MNDAQRSCPQCGTALARATIDLAGTPDVATDHDHARADFDPRSMAAVDFCPNQECPRHRQPIDAGDSGAEV